MLVVPDLEGQELRKIVADASRFLGRLYTIQKLTLLLSAYLAMIMVWRMTSSRWFSLLPLINLHLIGGYLLYVLCGREPPGGTGKDYGREATSDPAREARDR